MRALPLLLSTHTTTTQHKTQKQTNQKQAQALGVTAPPLRLDSQAKYGLLSRGDASIFMRFPPAGYREKIWDHAAGVLIVHEAGGRVTDGGGAPLDFSKGRYLALDRGIVAAPPAVHAAILRAVAELGAVPAA